MFKEQEFQIGELKGISAKTVEEHKKLYAGYVKNANLIMDHIAELSKDAEKNVYEINELQRRFGFEWGGMRNHEIYFNLLTGASTDAPKLREKIESTWGSFDSWIARFQAIALTRGIGWAMLYYDPKTDMLVNGWIDEQHLGQLADCRIIVALDMWEHSYVADYQPSGKKVYVADFISQMNWASAEENYLSALSTK
jgi:superoxide dismutase, Fe-Mn family